MHNSHPLHVNITIDNILQRF